MLGQFTYDAQVHTSLGLGQDPPGDCVRAAEAFGLEAVALTDHYDGEESRIKPRLEEYTRAASRSGVRVIPGASCDILDPQGRLTLPELAAKPFALVLISLSPLTEGVAREVPVHLPSLLDNLYHALVHACRRPFVKVLAAPFALGRFPAPLTPEQIPVRMLEEVAGVMVEHEVAFELNNGIWTAYPDLPLAELTEQYGGLIKTFSREGVKFITGSGARTAEAVGHFNYASRLAMAAGLEKSQFVDLRRLPGAG